jgi:hypothetical protein
VPSSGFGCSFGISVTRRLKIIERGDRADEREDGDERGEHAVSRVLLAERAPDQRGVGRAHAPHEAEGVASKLRAREFRIARRLARFGEQARQESALL